MDTADSQGMKTGEVASHRHLITILEAQKRLGGRSRASIYRDLADRRYRAVRLGGRTLIDAASLDDFIGGLPVAEFRAPRAA